MLTELTAINVLGYAASAAVLASFCMSTMIPLRILALGSNILFIAYGYADQLYPVFVLHAVLLPVNALRLIQFHRLVRDMHAARCGDFPIQGLLPYMSRKRFAAGETLVSKGERADRLYYLIEGELEVVELGKILKPGAIIGEIGVFAVDQLRTATVICRTECGLFELMDYNAKQLYLQDHSFSFAILQLIIARLLENTERSVPGRQREITQGAGITA